MIRFYIFVVMMIIVGLYQKTTSDGGDRVRFPTTTTANLILDEG